MQLLGRIAIVALLAAGLGWGLWVLLLNRSDVRMDLYARAAASRQQDAAPRPIDPKLFRATSCAASSCVMVEVGGMAFLINAGEGSAEGLTSLGLLRVDLDGILLTDANAATVAGLPMLRDGLWREGRREQIPVTGPVSATDVIRGVNYMFAGAKADPAAIEGVGPADATTLSPTAANSGVVVDTGVVKITAVATGAGSSSTQRLYRIDFDNRTLLVAGCGVTADDLASAGEGARSLGIIVPGVSQVMLGADRQAAMSAGRRRAAELMLSSTRSCLSTEQAEEMITRTSAKAVLLQPLWPQATDAATVRAWKEGRANGVSSGLVAGIPGAAIDIP